MPDLGDACALLTLWKLEALPPDLWDLTFCVWLHAVWLQAPWIFKKILKFGIFILYHLYHQVLSWSIYFEYVERSAEQSPLCYIGSQFRMTSNSFKVSAAIDRSLASCWISAAVLTGLPHFRLSTILWDIKNLFPKRARKIWRACWYALDPPTSAQCLIAFWHPQMWTLTSV